MNTLRICYDTNSVSLYRETEKVTSEKKKQKILNWTLRKDKCIAHMKEKRKT